MDEKDLETNECPTWRVTIVIELRSDNPHEDVEYLLKGLTGIFHIKKIEIEEIPQQGGKP